MAGAIDVSRRKIASHSLDGEQVSPRGVEEVEIVHLAQPVVGRRDRRVGVERVVIVVGRVARDVVEHVGDVLRVAGADAVVERLACPTDQVQNASVRERSAGRRGNRISWHGLGFAPASCHRRRDSYDLVGRRVCKDIRCWIRCAAWHEVHVAVVVRHEVIVAVHGARRIGDHGVGRGCLGKSDGRGGCWSGIPLWPGPDEQVAKLGQANVHSGAVNLAVQPYIAVCVRVRDRLSRRVVNGRGEGGCDVVGGGVEPVLQRRTSDQSR